MLDWFGRLVYERWMKPVDDEEPPEEYASIGGFIWFVDDEKEPASHGLDAVVPSQGSEEA